MSDDELMFVFKEGLEPIAGDDVYYDLFDGGYIDPEELLASPDVAAEVMAAIHFIKEFIRQAEEAGIIEES